MSSFKERNICSFQVQHFQAEMKFSVAFCPCGKKKCFLSKADRTQRGTNRGDDLGEALDLWFFARLLQDPFPGASNMELPHTSLFPEHALGSSSGRRGSSCWDQVYPQVCPRVFKIFQLQGQEHRWAPSFLHREIQCAIKLWLLHDLKAANSDWVNKTGFSNCAIIWGYWKPV